MLGRLNRAIPFRTNNSEFSLFSVEITFAAQNKTKTNKMFSKSDTQVRNTIQ